MGKKTVYFVIFVSALSLFSAKAFLTDKSKQKSAVQAQPKEEIKVTLIEGWSLRDIAESLENKKIIKAGVFMQAAKNFQAENYPRLSSRPAKSSLEGYLFPDTYRFFPPKNLDDAAFAEELIKKTLDNFENKVNEEMAAQAKTKNLSLHELVTLASIIEKETGRNAVTPEQKAALELERKTVASVFYNRLNSGMPLESDATVNYVTGKNNPTPTQAELDAVSPYNTYKNPGLPPGPICNPSLSSLLAALNPAKTQYFFFLHKQPSGEPVFSKTFEEHVSNKFKYLK